VNAAVDENPGDLASAGDPYELLGLPRSWAITDTQVRSAQVRALSLCHPDRHPEGPSRDAAMRMSARINEAVAVLASPELRAESFVRSCGGDGPIPQLPPDELMEWIERREWIEERRQEGAEGLSAISQWRHGTVLEILDSIRTAACDESGMPRSGADWIAARLCIARLRALRRACGGEAMRG
jgi:curved DNA-binding protein CbpA